MADVQARRGGSNPQYSVTVSRASRSSQALVESYTRPRHCSSEKRSLIESIIIMPCWSAGAPSQIELPADVLVMTLRCEIGLSGFSGARTVGHPIATHH